MKKTADLATSAVCAGIAVYVFYESATFQPTVAGHDFTGPAFFPRAIAAALAFLAIVLAARTLLAPETTPAPGQAKPEEGKSVWTPWLGAGSLALYLLALEPLGFLIATALLLLAFLLLGGVRKPHILGIYPVAASLLVYYVFGKLLLVYLPEGLLSL
jgi:putative tricarboxylic transport membrane protein